MDKLLFPRISSRWYTKDMHIDILTLFPEMFVSPFASSLMKKALDAGKFTYTAHQLRDWAVDRHGTVDTPPFGGGAGMVLRIEPFYQALADLDPEHQAHRILMTPQGQPFKQAKARHLSAKEHLIVLCGHYEGFDERIREHLVDEEISLGDFVLTGGEIPAMAIIEATVRLLPGVVGREESVADESHSDGLLEYPHYTRPEEFNGWRVPEILLSGHHANIEAWRRDQSRMRTEQKRPDLLIKRSDHED
jgi:tRNA (guanine37-N1)-methyltransferase